MQAVSYGVITIMTCGLLVGVGYLYKFDKINPSDGILVYVLGQFITALVSITSKIHRVSNPPAKDKEQ
jgi:hypothetical protein